MVNLILFGPAARLGLVDSQGDSFTEECEFIAELPIPLVDSRREVTLGTITKLEKSYDGEDPILYVEAEITDEQTIPVENAVKLFGLRFAVNGFVQAELKDQDGNALIERCLVKSIGLCSRNADYFLKNVGIRSAAE